jgi:hypothetical protein
MSKGERYYPDIKGARGDWHAKVRWDDGTTERLPVAHETYFRPGGTYYDPLDWGPDKSTGPQRALASTRMQRWVEAAKKTKKVVLQKDAINDGPAEIVGSTIGAQLTKAPEGPYFTRVGYIGVYDVGDVTFDLNGLRFNFLNRYEKVKL